MMSRIEFNLEYISEYLPSGIKYCVRKTNKVSASSVKGGWARKMHLRTCSPGTSISLLFQRKGIECRMASSQMNAMVRLSLVGRNKQYARRCTIARTCQHLPVVVAMIEPPPPPPPPPADVCCGRPPKLLVPFEAFEAIAGVLHL